MSFGQGGPPWGSGSSGGSTPDWTALAEEAERGRSRRRRWIIAGGGALATAAVAGIVAVAVVNEGGGDTSDKPSSSLPPPEELPSDSPSDPDPTFKDEPPPPPPPRDFLADAKRDKAPLSAATLFPSERMTIHGRAYKLADTRTSKGCVDAAHAGLGPVLKRNGCDTLYRATYTRDGLAVTVGIATFEDTRTAARVKKEYKPNLVALPGKGVPDFCRTVTCRTTANSFGRYAYFTIAGRTNGAESGPADKQAQRTALDASNHAYARILERGKAQSSEAAEAP